MGYIIKNTSPVISTRITDVGRRKISEGNFNIRYFQIGDSEISYDLGGSYDYTRNYVLMPSFNEHNNTGKPASNKQNVKYPYYVQGTSGETYGIPYMESEFYPVYNKIDPKGFFDTLGNGYWYAEKTSAYTLNANFIFELSGLTGGNRHNVYVDTCSSADKKPKVGDLLTLFFTHDASCGVLNYVYPVMTYKIQKICSDTSFQLDRDLPNFSCYDLCGSGRTFVYPSGMTEIYDTATPIKKWDFYCEDYDVNIWNMNIPWSESPAGINNQYETYEKFGSVEYLGTKEYLGYGSTGGTVDTDSVYYFNSLGDKIIVTPDQQKAIAIIHFTNNSTDHPYGEKFALEPLNPNALDDTGQAKNFKVQIPWLMWHKSPIKTIGLTLYVDPPNNKNNFKVHYLKSKKNQDMNDPGIRYYHLWDNYNNRVGKVFPDSQLIIIDDEELVAALSYKSNRNWTLPAPKVSLVPPNVCDPASSGPVGVLTGKNETLYVTYVFDNEDCFTNSLHNNYYQKIKGPDDNCNQPSQNVAVQFGDEFTFLTRNCCPIDDKPLPTPEPNCPEIEPQPEPSCLVPLDCIDPFEYLLDTALSQYNLQTINGFDYFISRVLELTDSDSNPSIYDLSGATEYILDTGIVINNNNKILCPDCGPEEDQTYVLSNVESFLIFAQAMGYTTTSSDKKEIPCCGNIESTTNVYNGYKDLMGSNLLQKCNTNFVKCFDSLNEYTELGILMESGTVEYSTIENDSNLCKIKNFFDTNEYLYSKEIMEQMLNIIISKGLVISCNKSTLFIGGVISYLGYTNKL